MFDWSKYGIKNYYYADDSRGGVVIIDKIKKLNRDHSYLIGNKFAEGHKPNSTSFPEGHIPWNKGISMHLSPKSEFKKGQASIFKLPVGSIMKHKQKNKKDRNFIKIDNSNKWEEYAKYLWKQKYGFIIKGDVVHHLDGNCLHDVIDNLIAFPRKVHPKYHNKAGIKNLTFEERRFYISRYLSMNFDLSNKEVEEKQISLI